MHSLILFFFFKCFYKKINCYCKAPLDSNGNGAIEVNVIIIMLLKKPEKTADIL